MTLERVAIAATRATRRVERRAMVSINIPNFILNTNNTLSLAPVIVRQLSRPSFVVVRESRQNKLTRKVLYGRYNTTSISHRSIRPSNQNEINSTELVHTLVDRNLLLNDAVHAHFLMACIVMTGRQPDKTEVRVLGESMHGVYENFARVGTILPSVGKYCEKIIQHTFISCLDN